MSNINVLQLRSAGVSLVLDCSGPALPSVLHWGADLGELSDSALVEFRRGAGAVQTGNGLNDDLPVSVVPEYSAGWFGLPGLTGHRDGRDFSAAFRLENGTRDGNVVSVAAVDPVAQLKLALTIELTDSGLVKAKADLTNTGGSAYTVDGLVLALPVPTEATELLDLTGRHIGERHPQRHAFTQGAHLRDNRRGRTGADATLLLIAGTRGFGFGFGEVWGLHTAWSGNHRSYAERGMSGYAVIGGGELLLPGEGRLEPQGSYSTPWIYGSYGVGLDQLSARFHEYLRARPTHPSTDRPVVLNTWEAVYFDLDLTKLTALADAAAEVGAERFVLDDGWFRGRRNDRAGLGDWYVDEGIWPKGLHPLVDHVTGLGLQFGLWVEPEMVNPDSDLAREHPDWILATGNRTPPTARYQQGLNLGIPAAYDYILERLDALLNEYDISYLKWDHNRDFVDGGNQLTGAAGIHEQTLAVYRLLDELKRRHPGLEIESCSSGGARVDLAVLERTDRVWGSDSNDALERQKIQRYTQLLLPPELIGCHVGPPRAHTTGRTQTLAFRAATALFGHFGIEWDISAASAEERAQLAGWVALHKELRPLLHTGRVVRADRGPEDVLLHGVVAQDGSRAVYSAVQLTQSVTSDVGRVRLPGLEPQRTYRVSKMATPGPEPRHPATWWVDGGQVELNGAALAAVGIQVPAQWPESAILLDVRAID
ncbi:glycoside hydrolase clan GH-D [Kribbella flavida DSM 17836]|uniref:Alpha-galactosidase n=1 Tax=Kribbella flavida (strain DSM 17836 / JCM 10339 / NBRC 14399) TaxID=479435 RepID=D2PNJ2_KRIFD|nr:alpha-galactosidase [Kribbella flavida]ADB30844.1 glycoside hydrolase clan GH-D [Kribbella flavida DSM 17836]